VYRLPSRVAGEPEVVADIRLRSVKRFDGEEHDIPHFEVVSDPFDCSGLLALPTFRRDIKVKRVGTQPLSRPAS
jgi:hypothetical protein